MVDENGTINGEDLEEESVHDDEHGARELDFILDIPLELSVELGKTKMLVNDLLQLAQGSIIELNKLAGEPLEVYINRKLIARGEVVVVNEKFGVRLTDVITPIDRVKSLAAEDQ
jgi:flagellar motor switch protein FliN/FliY